MSVVCMLNMKFAKILRITIFYTPVSLKKEITAVKFLTCRTIPKRSDGSAGWSNNEKEKMAVRSANSLVTYKELGEQPTSQLPGIRGRRYGR